MTSRKPSLGNHIYSEWRATLSQAGAQEELAIHYLLLGILSGLGIVHVVFTLYFFAFGITPMAVVNTGLVFFYITCVHYKHKNAQAKDSFIAIIVLEVSAHALLANYYIGWNSGFAIYVTTVSTILAIITNTSIFSRIAMILILSAVLFACDFYFSDHTPVFQLSKDALDSTRRVNYTTALLQLGISSAGYQYLLAVANTKLNRLANEDQLTGQSNRHAMIEQGQRLIEQCQSARIPLCAAIGDLDHFKKINDLFGHTTGNAVLVAVSQAITECRRRDDLTGRWGGEEFVWLLPNTTPSQAVDALNRLRERVQALTPIER